MSVRQNKISFIEFPVKNREGMLKAKIFYEQVFGWLCKEWGDDYIDTESSGIGSGFNADPRHKSAKPLVVIYTDNIERTQNKIIASGGTITRAIFSFPGGRRFHFLDTAGNELAVWSDK